MVLDFGAHGDDGNDNSEETKGTTEDLDDQHLHERSLVLSIQYSSVGSDGSNASSGSDVRQSHHHASGEDLVALLLSGDEFAFVLSLVIVSERLSFLAEEDGHNNTVNSAGLAEDN